MYSYCDDNCTSCEQYQQCELHLPYSKGLVKTQQKIGEIKTKLEEVEDDLKFLKDNQNVRIYLQDKDLENQKYELTEQLRQYRILEHKKIKILRKRRNNENTY